MFLHAGAMHILFNMLGVWMFGTELERVWGTQAFSPVLRDHGRRCRSRGGGRVILTDRRAAGVVLGGDDRRVRRALRPASGLRDALARAADPADPHSGPGEVFRHDLRRDRAAECHRIRGCRRRRTSAACSSAISTCATRRGGGITAEIKYRYLKWKMNRLRRKFDVYSGGKVGLGQARPLDGKGEKGRWKRAQASAQLP